MRSLPFLAPLLVAGAFLAAPARAQTGAPGLTMVQPLPGTTDADKLADAVRRLGASPRDLSALLDAGELSFRVGDATAAAAFFKRAEAINPNEPRIKAGIARILVNGEHPGEALRYFDQATRAGLAPALIADDRGLAYDLIGEQERAQRDYRLALRTRDTDETRRRYALSLGISGKREEALAEIDALLRRSDRGAWRARAFILAMGGDVAGAERIATSMMPPGMASGLAPFLARLPQLGPVDRAFAVHFGEVSASPSRQYDARMTPPLPALGPDPDKPVQLASVTPDPGKERKRDDRRRGRDRGRDRGKASVLAAAAPREDVTGTLLPPVSTASPINPPTALAAPAVPTLRPAPGQATTAVRTPAPVTAPPRTVAAVPSATVLAQVPSAATLAQTPPVVAAAQVVAPARASSPGIAAPAQVFSAATLAQAPPVVAAVPTAVRPTPSETAGTGVVAAVPSTVPVAPPPSAPIVTAAVAATPPTAPAGAAAAVVPARPAEAMIAGSATPVVTSAPVAQTAAIPAPTATPPRLSEDTILARIIAGIAVPATELEVAPMPSARQPAPAAASTPTLEEAAAVAERNAAADEEKRRLAAERDAKRIAARRAAADADRKLAVAATRKGASTADDDDRKATADRKGRKAALADDDTKRAGKKGAVARKGGQDADDADVPAAKSQVWVQVAGGSTESDLAKAWSAAQAKAPALAGRKGYTTPLRATNRVVTGPFKSEEEAQALVNKLAGQGVSAFTFTSAKGQKLTRVGAAVGKGKAEDAPAKPNGKSAKGSATAARTGKSAKDTRPAPTKSSRRK